ncbi:calcium-binding protein [Protofrankia coriariae]|uniref:Calcium-binding protein n=1 Tax=Protofrankia coriariae TaxID=1562887 RepID=A0ABR5F1R6_9ACTN|nr:calcium-binding protein [Protofrankia coriariae]
MFEATDTNNDGVIEWSDYERIVDRYVSGFGLDRDSREAQALRAAHLMYWFELRRHAGGNDRLDRDDYIAALHSLIVDTSRFNLVEGIPHAIFDVIDRNGDGGISKEEFSRYLQVWKIDPKTGLEVFNRLDIDGDGSISRHEFIRSWREFFYSYDPEVPGSFYFGRV